MGAGLARDAGNSVVYMADRGDAIAGKPRSHWGQNQSGWAINCLASASNAGMVTGSFAELLAIGLEA